MSELVRFGVSMEREIVSLLDEITEKHEHPNRSEAIRALVRQQMLEEQSLEPDTEVTAVISLIFHYTTQLLRVPLKDFSSLKLTTNLQMHLDEDIIFKMLVVTGTYEEVTIWANRVTGQKHVVGRMHIAATERLFEQLRT
ncbi:MAG TPA: ribbon-helix-helix protein, CopG family [Sphaerochaetaceae bacterium]|jgi:CopG family nickel-responsive transcriptional regulator|nr:ribbon-helix-helix protein, CopG family [Sphaerochaetaceae bacterium]